MVIATLSGYFGSVVMVIFAFTMEPLLAILGLSFLVLLNIISIIGFITTILGS